MIRWRKSLDRTKVNYKLWNKKELQSTWLLSGFQISSTWLFWILRTNRGTGFSKTVTLTLFHTSAIVGSAEIFSAICMSSGRTEPNTVYSCFHSEWSARLMKNSGPEAIQATEPLLRIGQSSIGSLLKAVPCASSVPWINA